MIACEWLKWNEYLIYPFYSKIKNFLKTTISVASGRGIPKLGTSLSGFILSSTPKIEIFCFTSPRTAKKQFRPLPRRGE